MTDWDRLPAGRRTAKRDRLLARYLRDEVHPFSATEARRLDDAGLVGGKLKRLDDLDRIRPLAPEAVDGIAAVLRPTSAGLASSPDRFGWWWATLTGRRAAFVDEEIDPRYRAIHFDDHGPLVVASSAADLDRLADLGRRALGLAGVRRDDAVVTVLPARGDLAFWHVTSGCRRGGVVALHLGDAATPDEVAAYAPTVLVGTIATLRRLAPEVGGDDGPRLVVVAERLDGDSRVDLAERFPGAAIRALWAPPGVRAPWAECGAGNLHTWPDAELLQVVDRAGRTTSGAGSVVWTPIGWRGTVVLRLRTGLRGRLLDEPCSCGARSARLELLDGTDDPRVPGDEHADELEPSEPLDPFDPSDPLADLEAELDELEAELAAVLDDEPTVASWFAEVARDGPDGRARVAVRLAPTRGYRADLEADLRRLGRLLAVDRLVVERPSIVRERLEAADGARVVTGPA